MDRTKAIDSVAVRPAPSGSTHAAGYFDDGTTVEAEWMNGVQDSLVIPLEDGGITPDTDDYEQFATLLSGVHGIVSSVRTTLATLAVTTKSKQAAIAAESALCSAIDNAVIAGKTQAVTGNYCAAIAGQGQSVGAGTHSAAVAGTSQTVTGGACAALAGVTQTVTGSSCAAIAGTEQTVGNGDALAAGGNHQITSGGACAVLGGQYYENIDDYCVAGGYGAAAPANFGDGLTNKNITWKLHDDTGNAEFAGKIANVTPGSDVVFDDGVEVEGDLTVGGELDLHVIDLGDLTCDWDTTGTDTEKSAVGVALTYDTAHAVAYFDLTINNTSGGVVDLNLGETIFCKVSNSNPGTLIGAFCKTTSATGDSAATLMSLRMMATACEDGAENPVIALVSMSAKAIPIPASDAGSVTVRCYLQYATLS